MAEKPPKPRKPKIQNLADPPPQTIQGVIRYHKNGTLDERIRLCRELREDWCYSVDVIAQSLEVSRASVHNYLRQIEKARNAYMRAFPEDFAAGPAALKLAIYRREIFEGTLRRELAALKDDVNPSNRVGLYKLLMRNMREMEELRGLLIERVEHAGEVQVKDHVLGLLEGVPDHVRNAYLDALQGVLRSTSQDAGLSGPSDD